MEINVILATIFEFIFTTLEKEFFFYLWRWRTNWNIKDYKSVISDTKPFCANFFCCFFAFVLKFSTFTSAAWPSIHCESFVALVRDHHIVSCEHIFVIIIIYILCVHFNRITFGLVKENACANKKKYTAKIHKCENILFLFFFSICRVDLFFLLLCTLLYFNCLCDLVKIGHIFCSFLFFKKRIINCLSTIKWSYSWKICVCNRSWSGEPNEDCKDLKGNKVIEKKRRKNIILNWNRKRNKTNTQWKSATKLIASRRRREAKSQEKKNTEIKTSHEIYVLQHWTERWYYN